MTKPNFLINKYGYYFMLYNEVAEMLDVSKLDDCQIFDNMEEFYRAVAVHDRHPGVESIEELYGSYIELYYDDELDEIIADHQNLDNVSFAIDTFAEDLSEFGEY